MIFNSMTSSTCPRIQKFSLTGVITDLADDDGPYPKVIYLKTNDQIYPIKLTKLARKSLAQSPGLDMIVQVSGEREYKPDKDQFRYKAYECQVLAQPPLAAIKSEASLGQGANRAGKILVCQKSNCCRRGGKLVWDQLSQEIAAQGLEKQITLKAVGCIGECKQGPALVVMPSKSRFTQVKPSQIPQLIATCLMPHPSRP